MELLGDMSYGQLALAWLLIGTCLLLMLVILLQRGRGGGLAGAFGGGGGSSAFGAKTGDVFTWITSVLAGVFVLLAVIANFAFDQSDDPVMADVTPAVTDAPVPVTIPLEEGQDVAKVELIGKDGKVIPVETKVVGKDGKPIATDTTPAQPSTSPEGGSEQASSTDDGGATKPQKPEDGGGKDPGK